jgi:hypothetical protein
MICYFPYLSCSGPGWNSQNSRAAEHHYSFVRENERVLSSHEAVSGGIQVSEESRWMLSREKEPLASTIHTEMLFWPMRTGQGMFLCFPTPSIPPTPPKAKSSLENTNWGSK